MILAPLYTIDTTGNPGLAGVQRWHAKDKLAHEGQS